MTARLIVVRESIGLQGTAGSRELRLLLGYTAKIERDFTAEAAAGFHHMRFRIKLLRGLPD